ncbi:MAG: zinc dependent phospholipase C family protein [Nitrososphaerota archaeon]
MPKTAVHVIVLDEVINRLRTSSNESERKTGEIMYRNRTAAVLGAIGPDLFFWAPDYELVNTLYNFYKNWKFVIEIYNATIGKVKEAIDAVGEATMDAVGTLAPATISMIRTLIEEIKETTQLFKSTLATGLFVGVIEGYDSFAGLADAPRLFHELFDLFTPPLQSGKGEKDWYWFDMLHYRWTGRFAKNLLDLADDETKLAYAYGYLTHIACDVVGHGFVNQIVGGPYRLHPQRHATVENFIDSWKFHQKYGESINEKLHELLSLPEKLPDSIVKILYNAFVNTYKNMPHPLRFNRENDGFLTPGDILKTYEVFKFIYDILGGISIRPPEEPFSGALDILAEALKNIEPPPKPPSSREMCSLSDIFSFGLTESSRECYEEFAEALEEWLEYLGELLLWTFETILAILDAITAALLSLPIMALMAILYGVQLALYNFYRQFRQTLVLAGLLYPEPDELQSSHGRNLTTNYQCSLITEFKGYPQKHSCEINNLQCPRTILEEPGTLPTTYERSPDMTPDIFINQEPLKEDGLTGYANAKTPAETRGLELKKITIGNAVSLSCWMIKNSNSQERLGVVFADWNLDSDRGYGYKCWAWDKDMKTDLYIYEFV